MVMTQNSMSRYTLEDFKEICQSGFDYHINDETLDIISALSAEVGAPDYVRTPNFNSSSIGVGNVKERNRQGRRRRKQHEMSDEDWEDLRSFHTKPKVNVSPEKALEKKYRGELNKIVSGFDESQVERLVTLFKEYKEMKNDDSAETLFFDAAICSIMNSELFAELLCDIVKEDDEMNEYFSLAIPKFVNNNWLNSFNNISCISEDEDYDKFCDSNRVNEKRLNTSSFLGHFYKLIFQTELMDNYCWFDLINESITTIYEQLDDELMKQDNEDIAFICCNNLFKFFIPILSVSTVDPDSVDGDLSIIEDIKCKIMDIINYDNDEYKSLSRKIIFTIQDHKLWL